MRYSFVLPAYKSDYLQDAIDSILQQTVSDFELIIVDDASPYHLESIVNQYDDRRIIFHKNKENIGGKNLVENWNKCIMYAKGDYVILASDDDIYSPFFLQQVNERIEEYPKVDIIRSRVNRIDSNGTITDIEQMYKPYMPFSEFVFYWSKGVINCIANYVFRRKSLLNEGGFVDMPCAWFSDDITVVNMSINGVATTEDALFYFRSSDKSVSWTFDKETIKKKWEANGMFYNWLYCDIIPKMRELPQNDIELLFQNNAMFNVRNRVKLMYSQLISRYPHSHFIEAIKMITSIPVLYKKEKVHLLIDYLL
ncbi:MAG: glycosyltransferase [Prevotella sp.]